MKHKPPALNLRRTLITRRIYRRFAPMVANIQSTMAFAIQRGLHAP